jgi:ABC-type spermidine/putrescine transport system permease subunit II
MKRSRFARLGLWLWVWGVLFFLFAPIIAIVLFGFDKSNVETWPIQHWTLSWYSVAWHDPQVRSAFTLSIKAAVAATLLSLILGSMAAFGVHRAKFFGRDSISLLLILPLALPGIITGVALNSAFQWAGIQLSIWTIIIGHTTFCIVVIYPARSLLRPRSHRSSNVPLCHPSHNCYRVGVWCVARICPQFRRGHRHHVYGGGTEHTTHMDIWCDSSRSATA